MNKYDQQSGHNYGILEMTVDDVPELIVKGNYVFSPYVIYAYIDGQVQKIGNHGISGDGGSTILPNGIVVFRMDTLGQLSYHFTSYTPDFTKDVFSFGRYVVYENEYSYRINGKDVSREEFIATTCSWIKMYQQLSSQCYVGQTVYDFEYITPKTTSAE